MADCLIVGAGMAGLMAATFLQENRLEVVVIDKGRGVGGRMATRRLAGGRADHGAQFFTVRSPVFERWVSDWQAAGAAREWTRGFAPPWDGHPRYRGTDGMTAVPKHLARSLDVRVGERVERVARAAGGWEIHAAGGEILPARSVLLTPPIPQSLALLDAGEVDLPPAERQALAAVRYEPCLAVLAALSGEGDVPAPGAVQVRGEPIAWIADNRQKGISEAVILTIHGGPAFSETHYEAVEEDVAAALLAAAEEAGWLRRERVKTVQVHRWRYAQPVGTYPRRCWLLDAGDGLPLAMAGDAFGESRVEGAALSGLAAAEALLPLLAG